MLSSFGAVTLSIHTWNCSPLANKLSGNVISISTLPIYGARNPNNVMAPGVNINSTYPGGQYTHMSGTSFAEPFVTGGIAVLLSIFPNATPAAIINI